MPSRRSKPYLIASRAQLAALASPVRQEILDAVQAAGPSSIAEVAKVLGRPADSLYYHARTLARLGLLVRRGSRRAARREEAVYDVPGRPMRLRYRPADAANRAAVRRAVGSVLRLAQRDFAAALESGRPVVDGLRRDTWGGRLKGWLTPADLTEINRCLERISAAFSAAASNGGPARPRGSRLCSVAFVLAPLRERQRRRSKKKETRP